MAKKETTRKRRRGVEDVSKGLQNKKVLKEADREGTKERSVDQEAAKPLSIQDALMKAIQVMLRKEWEKAKIALLSLERTCYLDDTFHTQKVMEEICGGAKMLAVLEKSSSFEIMDWWGVDLQLKEDDDDHSDSDEF